MKETKIISDSRFTILHDGERHCLVPTDNDGILLKSGSKQDCMFYMEQLKINLIILESSGEVDKYYIKYGHLPVSG